VPALHCGKKLSVDDSGFFEPDSKELVSIVENGGIPSISIWDVNLEVYNQDPRIVRYVPGRMKYITISYVWADGLGNPSNNAVRLGQILA
jgi:hypothetical protein